MGRVLGRASGGRRVGARCVHLRALLSGALVVAILSMLGASALLGAAPVAAQVTRPDFPTAEVAPEDALAYVVFTLDQDSEQWQLATDLLARAGIDTTLEDVRDEALTEVAGTDVPLDAFLGGEVAVVVTDEVLQAALEASETVTGGGVDDFQDFEDPAATPEAVDDAGVPEATGAAVVLDAQAPDTAFAGIGALLDQQAAETGTQVVEVDYQGVTIQYVVGSEDGSSTGLALARVDDLILLASSPTDLEPVIDTSQGTIAPLTELEAFDDVRAALDEDYLLFGFFNGVAAGEAQEAAAGALGSTATTLGGTDRYSGVLVRADDPGFRMETVAMAAEGASLPPAAANAESALIQQAPGDALFFLSAFDLGQTGFLEGIGVALLTLLTGQMGGAAATPAPDQSPEDFIAGQYEQAAGLLGFNLQTELFQQLVGEYGLWITSGFDPASITALFASEVQDPGTVTNALNQLSLLIQGFGGGTATVTTRQVDGAQVNVIDTGDPATPDLEFGVVEGRLLIGLGAAIDAFVDGPAESLADNEQFQEVMATLPDERNGTLYVDLGQIIPLLQGLAESAATDEGEDEFAIEDASPDCANYATQEEAQAAYDAGEEGTFDLDQDFDGIVCEDFFAVATPEPAVEAEGTPTDPAEIAIQADYSAIRAFALAAFDEDGMRRSSSILYIAEAGADTGAAATPVDGTPVDAVTDEGTEDEEAADEGLVDEGTPTP